jgi:hypothetical protein
MSTEVREHQGIDSKILPFSSRRSAPRPAQEAWHAWSGCFALGLSHASDASGARVPAASGAAQGRLAAPGRGQGIPGSKWQLRRMSSRLVDPSQASETWQESGRIPNALFDTGNSNVCFRACSHSDARVYSMCHCPAGSGGADAGVSDYAKSWQRSFAMGQRCAQPCADRLTATDVLC